MLLQFITVGKIMKIKQALIDKYEDPIIVESFLNEMIYLVHEGYDPELILNNRDLGIEYIPDLLKEAGEA